MKPRTQRTVIPREKYCNECKIPFQGRQEFLNASRENPENTALIRRYHQQTIAVLAFVLDFYVQRSPALLQMPH